MNIIESHRNTDYNALNAKKQNNEFKKKQQLEKQQIEEMYKKQFSQQIVLSNLMGRSIKIVEKEVQNQKVKNVKTRY